MRAFAIPQGGHQVDEGGCLRVRAHLAPLQRAGLPRELESVEEAGRPQRAGGGAASAAGAARRPDGNAAHAAQAMA